MLFSDTILALSSAPGPARRTIVRLSGPDAWPLALGVLQNPPPRTGLRPQALRATLSDPPVPVRVLLFAAPHSYTGLDIAELHLPGSPGLTRLVLDQLLHAGARPAEPGEFTAQAFFNAKMDLTEAEGIAASINAQNELQLRAATALRTGRLHQEIARLTTTVADLLAHIEAEIDFSDEPGVSFTAAAPIESTCAQLADYLDETLVTAVRADRLDALPAVVFLGKPNVGKSSLINALTQQDRALVSPRAGTTRDILAAILHTPTGDIRLLDVPGEEIPADEISSKMMYARMRALVEADLVIHVVDHTERPQGATEGWRHLPAPLLPIQNKADLLPPADVRESSWLPGTADAWGQVSAKTGYNIPRLRDVIARLAGRCTGIGAHVLVLNQRHCLILQEVKTTLRATANHAGNAQEFARSPELLAADLRHALDLLGQITGAITPDEILGRIFSTFCIGK